MKSVLATLLILVSIVCFANPVARTSPKRAPLIGNVKTVREYGLNFATEEEVLKSGKVTYSVDSYSNIGLKILSYYVFSGKLSDKTIYAYNEKGQLIEESYYDGEMNLDKQIMYSYDSSDNLSIKKEISSGTLWCETKYTYTSGLLTEIIIDAKYLKRKIQYLYNSKGQVIEEIDSSSSQMITRYSYYDNGNIHTESDAGGYCIYTYDDHNNEILAVESSGRKFTTEYKYDKQGNWIRCIEEIPNDEENSKQMMIREIEYY